MLLRSEEIGRAEGAWPRGSGPRAVQREAAELAARGPAAGAEEAAELAEAPRVLLCASLLLLQLWQRGLWLLWLLPGQLLCPRLLPAQDLIFSFAGILIRPSTIPGQESWAPVKLPHPPPFPSMNIF